MSEIQNNREWFIYTLNDPRTDEVRYVGWTLYPKNRLVNHISESRSGNNRTYKMNWIKSLLDVNLLPKMDVIDKGYGEWQSVERCWILHYRMQGARLTNATDGGIGNLNPDKKKRQEMSLSSKIRKEVVRISDGMSFTSIGMAALHMGVQRSQIRWAIKHGTSAAGEYWIHKGQNFVQHHNTRGKSRCKRIIRIEDGYIFNSITDAAISMEVSITSVFVAIKRSGKCAGYHWQYVDD